MADLYEYIGFTRTGMIRKWLEAHGWHHFRRTAEGVDLYKKAGPVLLDTASALFQELMDREAAYEFAMKAYAEGRQEVIRLRRLHSEVT